ncbi:MAG TPA: HAD-IB family hydrolase [Candidatus Binatia bacterium]|nr:HAD-IB family hydrolase [Candidatus Binatia bacterium]
MSAHAELTREIDDGPGGARIGAFFDVDQTLIAGFSAFEFLRDGVRTGLISPGDFLEAAITTAQFQLGRVGFSGFVTETTDLLRDHTEDEFVALGERIFTERLAASIYPESRALVQAHARRGHTVAVVSAATRYQIEPLARDLGIPHVLCTRLDVRNGRFTGELIRPTCYGDGKAHAARTFARQQRVSLTKSYFYTDSDEDLPLLDIVGNPRPTNPNRRLAAIAAQRGWPARRFTSRGTPGVADVVRTSLAVGSLVPSFLLGLPTAMLDGGWRRAVNIATTTWGELGTALAGIDLQVSGEHHLWSHRPAVFIFNHQSGVDVMLLCKLLRRDMVGIAKQEVRRNPIFGPAFALAGTVFIDRFNREKAIEAMQPAIDALRQGLSIAIAPEGTRSPTPRLGPFKKGAFHLAMAARAPIVPIVFRNALDALPKHAVVVRPATIEVVVRPPIATTHWKPEELDQRIADIHRQYVETLGLD